MLIHTLLPLQIDKLLSRIFWLRFYEDAARLYSTRLTLIAKERLPYLIQNIIGPCAFSSYRFDHADHVQTNPNHPLCSPAAAGGGPGWAAANAKCEDLREYFRLQIQVDLRELEDRVWHISSEWTYTAIRRMAITNGIDVSPVGLRATDLLTLIPLLEAMCENLENAPLSTYEIHPVKSIAGTFVSLYPDFRLPALPNGKNGSSAKGTSSETQLTSSKFASFLKHAPDILLACSHHPSGKCSLEIPSSTPWGASLYKITTAPTTSSKGNKSPSAMSPASMLFDALFPSLPRNPKSSNKTTGIFSAANQKTLDSDLAHAQIELRSILALGLSRLFIVLFQTALEFDIRSFGENVNLAFGPGYVTFDHADEGDEEYYGGCECCLDDFYDHCESSSTGKGDNPLHELWNSISKTDTPPKRKSIKRARTRSQSAEYVKRGHYNRYNSMFAPRPGAGLKAWDAVLHYEAIIREEEEEKEKKEEEKRLERDKYGLKGSPGQSPSLNSGGYATSTGNGNGKSTPAPGEMATDIDKLAHGIYASSFPQKRRAGKARESSECDGRGGGLVGWKSCRKPLFTRSHT